MVREGDPYPDHVRESVAAVQRRLEGNPPCHLAYQSRVGPVRWLTPSSTDSVRRLGHAGVRSLVVVPVSFVSEHIETLHELDIQLRQVATEAGITAFRRAPTPGTRADFVEGLAELVVRALPRD
jgi:ferrochelatase